MIALEFLFEDGFPPEDYGFYHNFTSKFTYIVDLVKQSGMEWNNSERLEKVCYCKSRVQRRGHFCLHRRLLTTP